MKNLKVSEAETRENVHGVDIRLLFNTEHGLADTLDP